MVLVHRSPSSFTSSCTHLGDRLSRNARETPPRAEMKLHENVSRWPFVGGLDRMQLPCRTAGDAGGLHLKLLFLQNCCKHADRTQANVIQAQSHDSKSGVQNRGEGREDGVRDGKSGKTRLSSNQP